MAEQSWQTIDSAPKDGRTIVAVGIRREHPDGPRRWRSCVTWYCHDPKESPAYAKGWFYAAPGYADVFEPTHWMPLPDGATGEPPASPAALSAEKRPPLGHPSVIHNPPKRPGERQQG